MSSASRPSEAVVKPTRSAKRTVTSLRSAAVETAGSGAGAAISGEPHSPQNFVPGAFAVPHDGQARERGLPHSPQNFRLCSFSSPQAGQATLVTVPVSHVAPVPQARNPGRRCGV